MCQDTEIVGSDVALTMDYGEVKMMAESMSSTGELDAAFTDSIAVELKDINQVFEKIITENKDDGVLTKWVMKVCPKTVEYFME